MLTKSTHTKWLWVSRMRLLLINWFICCLHRLHWSGLHFEVRLIFSWNANLGLNMLLLLLLRMMVLVGLVLLLMLLVVMYWWLLKMLLHLFVSFIYFLWCILMSKTSFIYNLDATIIFNKYLIAIGSVLLIYMMSLYHYTLVRWLCLRNNFLYHILLVSMMTCSNNLLLMLILLTLTSCRSIILCLIDIALNWVYHTNKWLIYNLRLYLWLACMLLLLLYFLRITNLPTSSCRIINGLIQLIVIILMVFSFMAMVANSWSRVLLHIMLMSPWTILP